MINNMKPLITKRFASYVIDMIIVLLIASVISSFIPTSEKVKQITKNLNETLKVEENETTDIKAVYEEAAKINYELSKETVISTLVSICVYILYFIVLPVYNNGQTVGKRLMKIKIKNVNDSKLTMNNMLFREMILHNIFFNIVLTMLIIVLDKNNYLMFNTIIEAIQMLIFISTLVMIVVRNDGRGLHDLIGGTVVINEEEIK